MILVLDTETTGVASWSRVVEIGAVVLDDRFEEVDAFHSLLCPDVLDERAERALAYNGITMDEVRAARPAHEVVDAWHQWVAQNRASETWAYGAPFDWRLMAQTGFVTGPVQCILRLARPRMPWRPKDPPLADAAEFFLGARPERAHRALDDARTAARVLGVLRR